MFNELLTIKDLGKYLGLGQTSIYKKMRSYGGTSYDPTFPKPVFVASNSPRWFRKDIDDWLESKKLTENETQGNEYEQYERC